MQATDTTGRRARNADNSPHADALVYRSTALVERSTAHAQRDYNVRTMDAAPGALVYPAAKRLNKSRKSVRSQNLRSSPATMYNSSVVYYQKLYRNRS